jgi:O-antigen ligase
LKTSLLYTLQHPVFGVGPGRFADFEGGSSQERGERGAWHETHNMCTQVSSECGIPALVFFAGALVSTYRLLSRIHQRTKGTTQHNAIAVPAFCVMLSLVGFCAAAFFLNQAYRFYLPALSGLAIAMAAAAEREITPGLAPGKPVPRQGAQPA